MSLALTFAVIAALLLGGSDFFAARSALTTPSLTVTRTAVATSVTLSPLALLIVHSKWTMRDSLIGGISGVAMITGLILLYHGYKVARMGIVAPVTSVLLAAVPVLWDLINGVHPGPASAVGMALGVVALVLTSYTQGGEGSASLGLMLGLASGVSFGVAFTLMGEVREGAGIAPVVVQRSVGLVILLIVWLVRRDPLADEQHIAGTGPAQDLFSPALLESGAATFAIAVSGGWEGAAGHAQVGIAEAEPAQVAFQRHQGRGVAVASHEQGSPCARGSWSWFRRGGAALDQPCEGLVIEVGAAVLEADQAIDARPLDLLTAELVRSCRCRHSGVDPLSGSAQRHPAQQSRKRPGEAGSSEQRG